MGMSHFALAKAHGFEEAFQYSAIPSLKKYKGVFTDDNNNDAARNWKMPFSDVSSDNAQVLDELKELEGAINLQLTSLDYNLSDEYMLLAALTVQMKKQEEMRAPMDTLTSNHMKYLQSWSSQSVSPGNKQ